MKKLLLAVFLIGFLSISLNSSAQNYLITFAGTGAATLVDSLEVENLATGKTITLNGGDILHLTSVVGISQPEKVSSSAMRIYPNPIMDNSILALHPPVAGDAVITVYEMTGKTVAKIHTYLENSRQEFRLSGLKNGMYLINVTGNTFQYSGKILSSGQADGNPGIEKVSSINESNIEKNSKKEFSETQGTIDMSYTSGDRLKFKAISGIYSTFKTDIPTQDKTLCFNFIPCTDGDGNNYPVVEIGEQIWMAENLKTTKYNAGRDIPLVTDGAEWSMLSTPGYCWYNNDSATNNATYGALYNWFAVDTVCTGSKNVCPMGWYVPTDAEWKTLEMYLGLTQEEADLKGWRGTDQGTQLKNTSGWISGGNGTNTSGFSALPGRCRNYNGDFGTIGDGGYWWSSTKGGTSRVWSRYLFHSLGNVFRYDINEQDGISVRCLRNLPNLTTENVTEITTTSAISGGKITNDWGNPVTARGVCWSTHENPTIADGLVTNSSEVDSFICLITGLTINTRYYVRTYATNSLGTAYGDQIIFKTMTGQISDIDNNTYYTVTIGTQIWMAENLKTTKFSDNSDIPLLEDAGTWGALSTPGYCWYNNDITVNKATYGALYNWYTVNIGKLCPAGWHVPTDAEWTVLTGYLGGEEFAGGKLKEVGWTNWINPNTDATNETGFTALPGGHRFLDGIFWGLGTFSIWWSSTENNTNFAWYRLLGSDTGYVSREYYAKPNGFSVRCLKDEL